MSAWAKPGVRCVCIRTMTRLDDGPVPVEGEIYIIRLLNIEPLSGQECIGLEGMINSKADFMPGIFGPFWPVDWFRPLVTQSDDVHMIRKLVHDAPAESRLLLLEEALNE